MGIKGEMSGTVCVTFTWDMYIYIYIYELFIAFVSFVVCSLPYCNLMVCVVFWVGKWQSRGSTGMFANLMAIHHIMLQFIQNHSWFHAHDLKIIFYEKYDWSDHSMIKCKFKKVNNWTTTTYAPMGAFDYTTNVVTMHSHSGMTAADKDQLIWVNSQYSKTLPNMLKNK